MMTPTETRSGGSASGWVDARDRAFVNDPVQRYLAEVRKHQVLTREEEEEHARRYRATGDRRSEEKLINSNLRLVVKIALEYQSNRIPLLDLVQEGNVGLLHAVRKFDPDRSIRLASYAQWWIRAYVLKFIMDNHKLVKVGTTQAQRKLFYNLKREKERLARQGLTPTPALVARSMGVREQDVVDMEARLSGQESSLDAPVQDGEAATLLDFLTSDAPGADEDLASRQLSDRYRSHLRDFGGTLQGRDAEIWSRRLMSEEPHTLQEIGESFGVSRERARQLEARVMQRLSKYLSAQSDLGDGRELALCG